jgi:hypothetical protein
VVVAAQRSRTPPPPISDASTPASSRPSSAESIEGEPVSLQCWTT